MVRYNGQLRDADYNIERYRSHHGKAKNKSYCNDIICFDIETTSTFYDGQNIVEYTSGRDADYWNSLQPLALPYIAMLSYNDTVYYVREFTDVRKMLDDIPDNLHVIIWVHNLAYEFQFLCNILTWQSVFARSAHKVIKCVSNEYPNIEFRCTYFLTRLSLDAWGKQCGYFKKTGDLDYTITRTPCTPLTEAELGYCEADCLVMYHGLQDYITRYQTPRNIPLTQTGTVRRDVKNLLTSDAAYLRHIKKLVPKDAEQYRMLQRVFAGGYTHANRIHAGRIVDGLVQHFDFASSYPYVMLTDKYPDTVWTYTPRKSLPDVANFEDTAYIMLLHFDGLQSNACNTYIQASKCVGHNLRYDNGRVISADWLEMYVTDVDYTIICRTYQWVSIRVLKMYKSTKRYLPPALLDYMLDLYVNKTALKGVIGKEDVYLQSKQYINSLYGMMVTAIMQADVQYNNDGTWTQQILTADAVNDRLDKLRSIKFHERRYFLNYSWGVYVTAYARRNLWDCILHGDNDYNTVYCDTDSIFIRGQNDFDWYNKIVDRKIDSACAACGLDADKARPRAPNGKIKTLGYFERETDCTEFLTLGAKRYVERRADDHTLHLTVAGINKQAVDLLHDDIANFADGFVFDKDAPCVNKKLLTYLHDMPTVQYPDGYISNYRYGINMRNNGYMLTMTDEYKRLIEYLCAPPEQFKIRQRGYFKI